jgi:acetoin utilization deacetylase AcuC-like enzyme
METIVSPDHRLHESPGELNSAEFVPAFEKPERAEIILRRVVEVGLGAVREPDAFPLAAITRIHDPRILRAVVTS